MMLKTLTFAALHFSTAFSITYVLTGSIGGVGVGVGGDGVVFGGVVARNRLSAEPFYRTVLTLGPQGEFFVFDFFVYVA